MCRYIIVVGKLLEGEACKLNQGNYIAMKGHGAASLKMCCSNNLGLLYDRDDISGKGKLR